MSQEIPKNIFDIFPAETKFGRYLLAVQALLEEILNSNTSQDQKMARMNVFFSENGGSEEFLTTPNQKIGDKTPLQVLRDEISRKRAQQREHEELEARRSSKPSENQGKTKRKRRNSEKDVA